MNKILANLLRVSTVIVMMMACSVAIDALDLPVKTVDGQRCYVYKVKKNESVYGIAKRLGISREQVVLYNPEADDGVHKDMKLYFPCDVFDKDDNATAADASSDSTEDMADNMTSVVVPRATSTVALMLPLGLDNAEPTRQNKLYLDFYKGFLLGLDTLASKPEPTIDVKVFDTEGASMAALMSDPFLAEASVIVAPENSSTLAEVAARAADNGSYVLNIFNIRDSIYASNPYVIQANTPQHTMYALAEEAFAAQYSGYTPVILRNSTGRNEKEGFVAYLARCCQERGIEPLTIEYDGKLHSTMLSELPVDAGQRYVVVPSSGTLAEFNKMAYVLHNWRDRVNATIPEDGGRTPRVEIFGYPDWTAFRGDALDILNRLEATVYSRFLDNFSGYQATGVAQAFKHWYGESMIESVPTQALLGFDTATMIVENLRTNGGAFDPERPLSMRGVQSAFGFVRHGDGGYANNVLFIIQFSPDGRQTARVI